MVRRETYWTTITDSEGVVEQELSFDAWGNRRDPNTWIRLWSDPIYEEPMFDRGYTGHEHMMAFGLINMNGRCYDPVMSSFLSVDAFVQSPDNSQNFNRYSYCLNNPLKYTDPSGWVMQGGMNPSNPFHDTWGQNFGEKIYTSAEVRQMLWSMDISFGIWMVGNEMHGGCSNSGVKPIGDKALEIIRSTLPKDARPYVQLDSNGIIDKDLLNSYTGESLNVAILKILANSDRSIELVFNDNFDYRGQDGNLKNEKMTYYPYDPQFSGEDEIDLYGETMGGLSTGESGFMGITLFPDLGGHWNSPNDNIIVVINNNLSFNGASEIYSHEMNGHAFLYVLNGGDHNGASHQPINGNYEGNKLLKFFILLSKKETIYNRQ